MDRQTEADPCGQLAEALRQLQDAYGPPKTRRQIAAWNAVQEALEQTRQNSNVFSQNREGGHGKRV